MSSRTMPGRNSTLVALVSVAAVAVWFWGFRSHKFIHDDYKGPTPAFFTTDDGQTLFVDDRARLTPFEKDGRQAVKAYVYRCPNGAEVVAYLERYTEQGRAVMERYRAERAANPQRPPRAMNELAALGRSATEVKRPGDTHWTNSATGAEQRMLHELVCANGKLPEPVLPTPEEPGQE